MFAAHAAGSIGALAKTYIEDVFGTTLYSGTGSAQSIGGLPALADSPVTQAFSAFAYRPTGVGMQVRTGQNLAEGGLVIVKARSAANNHVWIDTVRGAGNGIYSNTTAAQVSGQTSLSSFNKDGFTSDVGSNGIDYIGWCFAKKAKFLDIQQGSAGGWFSTVYLNHSLGMLPGMILIKCTSQVDSWQVYHRSTGNNYKLVLNSTAAQAASSNWIVVSDNHIEFAGTEGHNYVAYIFAHDSAADGMIQCGSFTTDASGNASVNLGWSPQFILSKASSAVSNWRMTDTTRGWGTSSISNQILYADTTSAEANSTVYHGTVNSTGFAPKMDANTTYIYMAIRAPETSSSGGGLVWEKPRGAVGAHRLFDTVRGSGYLMTDSTGAQVASTVTYTGNGYNPIVWGSGQSLVSWVFKRAPKFFDVVQFTGNGSANQRVPHSLGQAPGMIVVKKLTTDNWSVYHQSQGRDKYASLNLTDAFASFAGAWGTSDPTSTDFGVSNGLIASGATYIAYLFAHDTSADGLIQCGSFTKSGNRTPVTVGFEPQWLMVKRSNSSGSWEIYDTARGFVSNTSLATNSKILYANNSNAEGSEYSEVTNTGFLYSGGVDGDYIYMAIRRGPMRPPTSGTQVYQAAIGANVSANQQAFSSAFPVDLLIQQGRASGTGAYWYDRLRGGDNSLTSSSTGAEGTGGFAMFDTMNGVNSDLTFNFTDRIGWMLRRYPQVFDIVCYTGTGSARTVAHNLGVAPEMLIVRRRDSLGTWTIYHKGIGITKYIAFDTAAAADDPSNLMWNNTLPTASVFSLGNLGGQVNHSGGTFVAYLFASLPGVSKVGSYVGTGVDGHVINCSFSAGARLVLIKAASSTGAWFVFDTVRGIVASASDPRLLLNATTAEASGDVDVIDPHASGFIVNTAGNALNVAGVTYIFLALA